MIFAGPNVFSQGMAGCFKVHRIILIPLFYTDLCSIRSGSSLSTSSIAGSILDQVGFHHRHIGIRKIHGIPKTE